MSKPTKLIPERMSAIIRLAGKGVPMTQICRIVGIADRTLYHWLERGRDGEKPYVGLLEGMENAQAELVERLNDVVLENALEGKNWQAAMTWLERYDPDRWGKNKRVTVEHRRSISEAVAVDIDVTEELDRRLGNGDKEEEDED